MKLLAVLLSLLPLLALAAPVPIPYDNCGTSKDHIHILSATASEWPPVPGSNITLDIAGSLDEQVTGGTYSVALSFDGFQVGSYSGTLASLNISLPIGPLKVHKQINFTVPSIVPGGSTIVANVTAADQNGQELICLGLQIVTPSTEMDKPLDVEAIAALSILDFMGQPDEEEQSEAEPLFAVIIAGDSEEKLSFGEVMTALADGLRGDFDTVSHHALPELGVPVPYTNCGHAADLVVVKSITSTVWPPKAGSTSTVQVVANVLKEIDAGTYNLQLSVDGFPLINTNGELSDYVTLPVKAGAWTLSRNVTLPATLPFSGSVGIQLQAQDNKNNELFCLGLTFTI